MIKSLCCIFGLLLALSLPAHAQAQRCGNNPKQASLITKINGLLANLTPAQQGWLLGHAGCQLNATPNLSAAVSRCSCNPAFACAIIAVLRRDSKISSTDPSVLACGH
jgi:hypothetical protein